MTTVTNTYFSSTFSYDKVGNILSIENNALKPANGQKGGASLYSYTYDNHYRLNGATGQYESAITGTHTYQLDMSYGTTYEILTKERHHYLDGVEQQKNALDMGYEYNSAQPHAASKIGGDVYEYDKNGNVVFIDRHDLSQRRFVWDDADRLSSVQDDYRQTSFFYDFSGERVIKSRSSGRLVYVNEQLVQSLSGVHDNFTTYVNPYLVVETLYEYTKFVYMGSRRMVAKIGDGSAETPAKPDPRGNEPSTEYENLQFFFHSDHLGSTSYMTDLSGEVSQHVEYFPYGGIMTEERSSGTENQYLFNGKELDLETGLYYYGARYMDPDDGWLSVDPLAEKYPNMSGYAYCAGNPINLIDPDGREIIWLNWGGNYSKIIRALNRTGTFNTIFTRFIKNQDNVFITPTPSSYMGYAPSTRGANGYNIHVGNKGFLNSGRLTADPTLIAKVIMHEGLHSRYHIARAEGNLSDYPTLERHYNKQGTTIGYEGDHEAMAEGNISTFVQGMRGFDASYGTQHSDDWYNAIAWWGSLSRATDDWKDLDPLIQSRYKSIQKQ